jgi:hypothetical protein
VTLVLGRALSPRWVIVSLALVSLALTALVPTTGQAQTDAGTFAQEAGAALQEDPLFVHPDVESALPAEEAERLRQRILEADAGPIYIAVLPERAALEAGGDVDLLLASIGRAVGREGTYAAVVGDELRAGATETGTPFAPGTVPTIATEAVEASSGEGAAELLMDFVGRLDDAASSAQDEGGGSGGIGLFPVLVIAGLAYFAFSRARRRREDSRQLEEVREVAMEDLVALGDDLRSLDLDVEMPGADPAAKRDYVRALECYEKATADIDRARRPEDLAPVTSALEEGRFAITSARARLEGRPVPEHRPPCFFDPRHGPSVRDVDWAPPGGAPRPVPACEDDARRVETGQQPITREVAVGGQMMPYWGAPAYFGPWAGGYFGAFGGGFLPGLLIGSAFGGGFGGLGYGGDSGGGDGGDFGGGDFGGGDFGGGDFGGGDFGGGDFGGGD